MFSLKKQGITLGIVSVAFFCAVYFVHADTATVTIPTIGLPVVSFGALLTFIVRIMFIIAGISALLYGLMGGLDWISSGGEKDNIDKARDKIIAAIIGLFILIFVLTIMWMIEQVVFHGNLCFGISCEIRIPTLTGSGGSGGGGGGGGGGSTPSPIPTSCKEYCISLNESFTDGECASTLSGDPEDCPNKTHNERGLPSDLQSICKNHPNEKCCCRPKH